MIFENYISNLDTTTKNGITYTYGSNKIVISNDIIKTNLNFKLNDIEKIIHGVYINLIQHQKYMKYFQMVK